MKPPLDFSSLFFLNFSNKSNKCFKKHGEGEVTRSLTKTQRLHLDQQRNENPGVRKKLGMDFFCFQGDNGLWGWTSESAPGQKTFGASRTWDPERLLNLALKCDGLSGGWGEETDVTIFKTCKPEWSCRF